MQITKLKKYLNEVEPIFDYNILTPIADDDILSTLHTQSIHLHQLSCYNRLFDILTRTGAYPIKDWYLPDPIRLFDNYQNSLPILNHELLYRFETWFEELPRTDAEFFAAVLLFELRRLDILANYKYTTGFDIKPGKAVEMAKKHFRFVPNGRILQVDGEEIYNENLNGDHLTPQHDIPRGELMITRMRDSIAALDLRTTELRKTLSNTALGTESITSIVEQETQTQVTKILDKNRVKASKDFANLGSETIKNVEKVAKSVEGKFSSDLQSIEVSLNQTKDQIDRILKDVEEETKSKIESVASGFKTDGVLKSAFDLWDDKEKRHRKSFYVGITIFVVLILIIAGNAYTHFDMIIKYLGEIFANTTTTLVDAVSRVVLITIPIGTTIWVLRALLRWSNLNLALAEDAAQRSVMAQTYVNLLTNGDVTEDKDDRKVMLEAIFRPLPGIQEMDTAPPSIINFSNPKSAK